MNRSFALVFIILVVIFIIFYVHFAEIRDKNLEILKFNSEYEIFDEDRINGLDIATVVNKAVNNNDTYAVSRDEKGFYDIDDPNVVEIYISLMDYDENTLKSFKMESFYKAGMSSFISSFADAYFKCTKIEYHKDTGKIKSMTFELLD